MADGTLKVGTIITSSGSGTITLGQSGETVSVPSGATLDMSSGTMTLNSSMKMTPAFSAKKSDENQSIANNTAVKCAFDTVVFDTDSCYDTSNYRWTPNVAGKYCLVTNVRCRQTADFNDLNVAFYKNGSGFNKFQNNSSHHNESMLVVAVVEANGTDYFEVFMSQTSGNTDTANIWEFSGYKIIGA